MISATSLLTALPAGLRDPLIEEYKSIIQNFMERRWSPSELSGGKFCEIVFTILDGYASGTFPPAPKKPNDFVTACRTLESRIKAPRSLQILIPRLLPALYEIRNNRGVGHAGGDVNPNPMDAAAVISMTSWTLAELIRVFHNVPIAEAQSVVDSLAERRIPLVWSNGVIRRVLRTDLKLKDQIMLLVGSTAAPPKADDVFRWSDYQNRAHFNRILKALHTSRFIELDAANGRITILPPGSDYVSDLVRRLG